MLRAHKKIFLVSLIITTLSIHSLQAMQQNSQNSTNSATNSALEKRLCAIENQLTDLNLAAVNGLKALVIVHKKTQHQNEALTKEIEAMKLEQQGLHYDTTCAHLGFGTALYAIGQNAPCCFVMATGLQCTGSLLRWRATHNAVEIRRAIPTVPAMDRNEEHKD
ncbi:MAG: hypothetical protein NTX86_03545 [Candidatus Dependentiae bacterium]|nr:hypothetical protein [Candidatus Dependentiae bacterium]